MYKEAGQIATVYGVNISLILKKREKYQQEVKDAQAELNACDMNDAAARRKAFRRRNTAKAALHWYEERSRQEMRNMIHLVRKWAERKSKNAYDWLAALYAITCKGSKSTGSIVFYAFPQELVNMIAERTGGRPVTVAIPDLVDGDVYIDEDGNVYLVDQVGDGQGQIIERETFLMQVTRRGDLIYDHGRTQRIHPVEFESGRAEVKDGKLELHGSKQKPKVLKPKPEDDK
jgi:DNA polymerase III delta prime subunit